MLLLAAVPVMAQEVPQVTPPTYNCDFEPACEVSPGIYGAMGSPVTSKFKLSVGGFVKLDYAYNSVNMGAGIPAMATVQQIPKSSSPAADQEQSIFTARQSRILFKVDGPTFLGAKTGSLIETDFYGGGGSSNETASMRLRLAYGSLNWKNTRVLFGQDYDMFGPAVPSTVDFGTNGGTGAPANPRVPQIRVSHSLALGAGNALMVTAGLQNPVQDKNQQTTTASFGAMPNVAGQIMFTSKALGAAPGYYGLPMKPLTAGLFGLYGNQAIGGNSKHVDSLGYGFYTFVPLLKSMDGKNRAMTASFEGQAYMAANMNFNGATGGTLVGAAGNMTAAKGYGYYGQLMFYPIQQFGITAGYSSRRAYDYSDYTGITNFEKSNSSLYANIAYDLNASVRVAAEYQNLNTQYGNSVSSTTNPNLAGTSGTGTANIGRLAAYYFF